MRFFSQAAEKALMYYKGCEGKTDIEKTLLTAEFDRLIQIEEERKKNEKLEFNDFFNRMAFKGIATSIAMAWFIQITGSFFITNYASLIFKKSGSAFSSNVSSIILAVIQIIGGLVSTQLGDTFARRTILFTSLFGSAVGLFAFSTYLYAGQHSYDISYYTWAPELCLSVTIFMSSAGVVALANICAIENFPPKVRIHFLNCS